MTELGSVSVVVVTYNPGNDLVDLLDWIRRSAVVGQAIIVDNCSTDGSRELLKSEAKRAAYLTVILNKDNVGFARAVNMGLARRNPGNEVLLLNPDARIGDASLDVLVRRLRSDRSLGIVAPMVFGDNTVSVISAGQQPYVWPMITHFSGLSRAFPHLKFFKGRHLFLRYHSGTDQSVGWTSGCCMLVSEMALHDVGPLSERWFMYGEDLEFCRRITEAGYGIVLVAAARAVHEVGGSVRTNPSNSINVMWAVNTLDYFDSSLSSGWLHTQVWKIVFSMGLVSRALADRIRGGPDRRARSSRFFAFARAVW